MRDSNIMDKKTILSNRDRDIFLAILASDDEPNEAMKRAARTKRKKTSSRSLSDSDI